VIEDKKVVVCIAEMARMVGLSRARFYQLIGTTFPAPLRNPETGRPFYDETLQQTCLEVRKRNCGVDGRPVMFYARRITTITPTQRPKVAKPKPRSAAKPNPHAALLEGLRSLGLDATAAQVEQTVKVLFPHGVPSPASGEVLRTLFLHLKRQDSAGNVER